MAAVVAPIDGQFSERIANRGPIAVVALAISLSLACPVGLVRAQDPAHCIDDLSDDAVQYRLKRIEDNFREGKQKAKLWRYLWMVGLLGLGGIEAWLAVDAHDQGKRWDRFGYAYLSAASTLVGLTHAIVPAPDVYGHKRITRMPASTEADRKLKLKYATKTLDKSVSAQGFMGGGVAVAVGLVVGVVGGSVYAAKWSEGNKWMTSVLFLGPTVVMGVRALTAPMHSVKFSEDYRSFACSGHYYDSGPEGAEFNLSALGAGQLLLKF